jgi:tetratricopeptide (TPR) repeat protein
MKSMNQLFHALAVVLCGLIVWTSAPELAYGQSRPIPVRNAPVRNAPVRNAPARNAPARNASVRPTQNRTLNRTPAIAPLRALDDEAVRLLKLGNTYREARDYDLAQKYINQGLEALTKSGNRYWQATGYEYLGLTYRDMGDRQAALAALERASELFTALMRNPSGKNSRNSTQMLLDNMQRDDAARLQPMPLAVPPAQTLPSRTLPSRTPQASTLRPRDLPQRTNPSRADNELAAERTLNAQLTQRLAALEERIRALDKPSTGAASLASQPSSTSGIAPPTSANPPGAVARTLPMRTSGDKPQGEFAPFQTDKKPVPTPIKPAFGQSIKKDTILPLPIFTLQIGAGVGYFLNHPQMAVPPTPITAIPTVYTGGTPDISFPLLSISGDFFLLPNFSLGLMYGYYPGLNKDTVTRSVSTISTAQGTATTITTTATTIYRDYHFVTLRPSVHFVRNHTVDVYAGLALGSMLNFQPLRLYAGLFLGGQYNFTRQFGLFLELSGGGQYTGETTLAAPLGVPAAAEPRLLTIGNGIVQLAGYGRLGLAFNF